MAAAPIPTWYSGVLYRSRLEARYATFFDALGIVFEYETQGFDVDGIWYLPDFMLPAAGGIIWAEVKPSWDADPEGVQKFRHFTAVRPQPSMAALLVGIPSTGPGHVVVFDGDFYADDPLKGLREDDSQEWRPCPGGHHFGIAWPGQFRAKFAEDGCADNFGGDGEEKLQRAINAARSARFTTGKAA